MVNIKPIRDGDRLIIVIENCKGEVAEKVNAFLASLTNLDGVSEQEEIPVPDLKPIKVAERSTPHTVRKAPITPIDNKKHQPPKSDIDVNQLVKENGISAILDLLKTKIDIKTSLECKKLVHEDVMKRKECASLAEIKKFFHLYEHLEKKDISYILQSSSYATLNDFLDFAPEEIINEAYYTIRMALLNRTA